MDRRQQELVITNLIRALGTSLKNRGIYPASHPQVRNPVEKVHKDLNLFFAERNELALAIADGTLVFEGVPIFSLTSSLETFMGQLVSVGAPAVIFQKGLSADDLNHFVRFLHETKEHGLPPKRLQQLLEEEGASHIRLRPMDEEEDEQELARQIYDNALSVMVSILKDVRAGRIPSGAESEQVVKDISSMLTRNRDAMIALTLIKNFDEYTYNHSVNVAVLSLAIADALAIPAQSKIDVGMAGLLHDIGKTQLALDLIRKPGGLTSEEFEEIKKHPEEGYEILGKMSHIREISAYLVREHHMRFDRSGYPRLDADYETHQYSNIIPVADCYDALTTMRSYQKARYPQQALELMEKLAGNSLDPEVVSLFVKTMGVYPVGTMVRLSTLEIGVVSGMGIPGAEGPKVFLLFDKDGKPLSRPEIVETAPAGRSGEDGRRAVLGTVNPNLFPAMPVGAMFGSSAPA